MGGSELYRAIFLSPEGAYIRSSCGGGFETTTFGAAPELLRSLIGFRIQDDLLTYRRLERIAPTGEISKRVFRYVGAAVMTGDRVFMHDYETGAGIELTQTILRPDYSHRWNRLHGIKLGVAANSKHQACAVRLLLECTPTRTTISANLRSCGLFPAESTNLPPDILPMIENSSSGPYLFNAWNRT